MSFCKLRVNKKSDDGIESIYQSKIDSSLNSDSKVKKGIFYILRVRLTEEMSRYYEIPKYTCC